MGLFSKRTIEPLVYPQVDRSVYVPTAQASVVDHLAAYSRLWSARRAQQHEVLVGAAGGWTVVRLPGAVHPWQLHNVAFWMLDCPGVDVNQMVIAEAGASPDHPPYRLVRDPEIGDALAGWDEGGAGWTVHVPGNDIVRGEDVPVPRSLTVPSGFHALEPVSVLLEDPGPGMNERNNSTATDRRALTRRADVTF